MEANMRLVKQTAAVMSCAILALAVQVQQALAQTPELKKVEIVGVRDAQISSQQIIALKKGFYKANGLDVTNTLIQSGPEIGPMIAGGSAPISIELTFTALITKASGTGLQVVAPLAQVAGTQAVVGGKGLKLARAKDLEGKSIGIPAGAAVMIAIQNMGKELGVDVSKIKFVNLAPTDAILAMERGDVDAVAFWEPYVTKAVLAGGTFLFSGNKSELPGKKGPTEWMSAHTTIQVTDEYRKKYPNTIKAILKSLEQATDFINSNRPEAIKILAPEIGISEDELRQIMGRNTYSMVVDQSYWDGLPSVAKFFYSSGAMKTIPKESTYNDFSLLKEVDPSLIKVGVPK
jgi:sulfonate transport system substrate-binding protein